MQRLYRKFARQDQCLVSLIGNFPPDFAPPLALPESLVRRSWRSYLEFGSGGRGGMIFTSALPLLVTELRLFCSQMYSSIVQVG